ncbi:hypothetical protein MMPV_007382 [Pyropia vietnamensis]
MWSMGSLLFAVAALALAFRYAPSGPPPRPIHAAAAAAAAAVRGDPAPGSGAFFDAVAPHYDVANRLISLGLDHSWRDTLVTAVLPDAGGDGDDGDGGGGGRNGRSGDGQRLAALDVATGTGDVALALAARPTVRRVVGVDPSVEMLSRARDKAAAAAVAAVDTSAADTPPTATDGGSSVVSFEAGVAEALSYPDGTFDVATVAFGVRNFHSRVDGLADLARVLGPGGVLGVLEVSPPGPGLGGTAARAFVSTVVPLVGGGAGLLRSVEGAAEAVAAKVVATGDGRGAFDWLAFGRALADGWSAGVADYTYLAQSMMAFPGPPEFSAMLVTAGFQDVTHTRLGPWGLGPDLYVATKAAAT